MSVISSPMEDLAAVLDFTCYGFGENHGFLSGERKVWCNWCQCSIRPQEFAVRQHRRICTTDPRVAAPPAKDDRIG